jgi:uncharacterized protein YukE
VSSGGFDVSPDDLSDLEQKFSLAANRLEDVFGALSADIQQIGDAWGGDSYGRENAAAFGPAGEQVCASIGVLTQALEGFRAGLHDMATRYHIADGGVADTLGAIGGVDQGLS